MAVEALEGQLPELKREIQAAQAGELERQMGEVAGEIHKAAVALQKGLTTAWRQVEAMSGLYERHIVLGQQWERLTGKTTPPEGALAWPSDGAFDAWMDRAKDTLAPHAVAFLSETAESEHARREQAEAARRAADEAARESARLDRLFEADRRAGRIPRRPGVSGVLTRHQCPDWQPSGQ